MKNIFIVAAKRTPQGRLLGGLVKRSATDLAKEAGRKMLETIDPRQIDQVIIGNVLSAGQGMNIARQVGMGLNVPEDRPACTINMMCASGMHAVILAARTILAGDANVVLCGGTESMSNAPFLLDRARSGYRLGDGLLIDSILRDGLVDAFSGKHMGLTVDTLAEQFGIDRIAQDTFALQSQQKYAAAHARGAFNDEIVPVDKLSQDEHPRPDVTLEKLSTMKPAFKADGTVTAGNSSGINDGAAMLVVCSEDGMRRNGWTPLAKITGWYNIGCAPDQMALGPVRATAKLCQNLNININAFDTIELNEAFAAQSLVCIKEMKVDGSKVNPNGGAIALGHPIGASGARLIVHLAHRIARKEIKKALATLCVGGGMGSAVALETA
ncbi:MAG: acetyl-CoA C-acyltransferase [Kiritimatiellae bacterium]|nr:acetyl-CoA C-acyltransferase [Kiritimatiellia bacterium]MDD5521003.1 acetyl-CoA C-acyltransferase [Kiritimatiellia bacterium]